MPGLPADLVGRRRRRAALAALVAGAALAGSPAPPARAAACAPPGNSAVQQYLETLSGANCTTGSGAGNGPAAGSAPGGGRVTASEAGYLARHGAAGQALLKLLASSPAPAVEVPAPPSRVDAAGLPAGGLSGAPATSAAAEPAAGEPVAVDGGQGAGAGLPAALLEPILSGSGNVGGVGWLLPFCLAAVTVGAFAAVARRVLGRPRADRLGRIRSPNATKL